MTPARPRLVVVETPRGEYLALPGLPGGLLTTDPDLAERFWQGQEPRAARLPGWRLVPLAEAWRR